MSADFSAARRDVAAAHERLEAAFVSELGEHQARALELNDELAEARNAIQVLSAAIEQYLAGTLSGEALAYAHREAMLHVEREVMPA